MTPFDTLTMPATATRLAFRPLKKREAPVSRAQEFQQWILLEIAKLPPDTCLPPDRELGAQWGLSTITVQRVLAKLRDEGKVIRIPGKGTFTPNLERGTTRVMNVRLGTSRESSVEHLAASLIRMISEGVYRKGKALPPVKFIRNQFRVSSETVTTAYQRMESLGYVEKIGKSYWVGRMDQLLSDVSRQEVIFFRFESGDFHKIFNSDPIALAFQKMERELYHSGYSLHPEQASSLDRLAGEWETSGRYPAGLVFYGVDASHLPFFRDLFARHPALVKQQVRVLIHGQNNDLSELAQQAHVFSRGNVETDMARALAHYLQNQGAREANLCIRESELSEPFRPDFFLKVALAIESAIPGFVFRLVVESAPDSSHPQGVTGSVGPEYRKYLEAKYPGTHLKELDGRIVFTPNVFETCRGYADAKVWILSRDGMASEAMEWTRERGLRVPQDISIIGLQNDPRYYHLGISSCGPDWDGMGYVMAHAIIGDVKLARSQKGFLKVRSQMVNKLTTARS
ncbi:MAG: Bacterial regulatory protein gntR family [Fibrobacteria bacterium]|nr:Bacterial regulatory protein gntR family [Fibrobacteria bacterium]